MSLGQVKVDLSKLEGIEKALKSKYKVRVGILGNKAAQKHDDTELTNYELGAIHEYGSYSAGIPKRSFLLEPLSKMWGAGIIKSSEKFAELLAENRIYSFFRFLGFKGEEIVSDAFSTGGFGKWKPLKPETIKRRKKSKDPKPLTDTGQLARSITSEVYVDNKRKGQNSESN